MRVACGTPTVPLGAPPAAQNPYGVQSAINRSSSESRFTSGRPLVMGPPQGRVAGPGPPACMQGRNSFGSVQPRGQVVIPQLALPVQTGLGPNQMVSSARAMTAGRPQADGLIYTMPGTYVAPPPSGQPVRQASTARAALARTDEPALLIDEALQSPSRLPSQRSARQAPPGTFAFPSSPVTVRAQGYARPEERTPARSPPQFGGYGYPGVPAECFPVRQQTQAVYATPAQRPPAVARGPPARSVSPVCRGYPGLSANVAALGQGAVMTPAVPSRSVSPVRSGTVRRANTQPQPPADSSDKFRSHGTTAVITRGAPLGVKHTTAPVFSGSGKVPVGRTKSIGQAVYSGPRPDFGKAAPPIANGKATPPMPAPTAAQMPAMANGSAAVPSERETYKVIYSGGAVVRTGVEMTSAQVAAFPCGATFEVLERFVNEIGITRLRTKVGWTSDRARDGEQLAVPVVRAKSSDQAEFAHSAQHFFGAVQKMKDNGSWRARVKSEDVEGEEENIWT